SPSNREPNEIRITAVRAPLLTLRFHCQPPALKSRPHAGHRVSSSLRGQPQFLQQALDSLIGDLLRAFAPCSPTDEKSSRVIGSSQLQLHEIRRASPSPSRAPGQEHFRPARRRACLSLPSSRGRLARPA